MPIILRKLHTKYDLSRTRDKSYLHKIMVAMVTMRYVADAYNRKQAACQI